MQRLHRSISTGNTAAVEAVRRQTQQELEAAAAAAAAAEHANSGFGGGSAGPARGERRSSAGLSSGSGSAGRAGQGGFALSSGAAAAPASLPEAVVSGPLGAARQVAWRCRQAVLPFSLRPTVDPAPPSWREYAGAAKGLLVASFPRLFVSLSMVWNYPITYLRMLAVFTLTSHATALQALCDCSLLEASLLVVAGYGASLLARLLCLRLGVVAELPSYFF
jgi:hypothetical protein